MTLGSDTWFIDSGGSKHMTSQKKTLSSFEEKDSPHKVSVGDDYQYPIKGIGEATYNIDSGTPMKMKDVHVIPLWILHMMKILHSLIILVSWFFLLPTLPYFEEFILMKYG